MRTTAGLALLMTVGCTATGGDDRDDSFGGIGAKADSGYTSCQLAETLKYVNESSSDRATLEAVGLASEAAEAIVAHRLGADGQAGTGDDDIFDDLEELDAVDYVGMRALGALVYAIVPRCEVDLATRPFIDDQTFTGQGGGWSRDNQEVESVLGVTGLTGQRLRSLLLQTNGEGRTLYERLRRSRAMEALSYDYPIDEQPWDADRQRVREAMPLVALTIEPGRFEPGEDGPRELSLGTDLMDDTYYDTHGLTLLGRDVQLRGRARWDTPTEVRRLLIAAKFGTEIDAEGNKTNNKVDIRTDSGDRYLASLDDDVRRGLVGWNGSDAPAVPVRGVYEQLAASTGLVDVGGHHGVLLLEPMVHLRSTRSRYHLNEARIDSVRALFRNGATRIQGAIAMIERYRAAGTIAAADRAQVDAVLAMARRVLDRTLLAERVNTARPALAVSATSLVLPDAVSAPADAAGLDDQRVVAETISAVYHELATALDDADRLVTGATDEDFDAYVDMFRAWRVSLDPGLAAKTVYDPFVNSYRALSTASNEARSLADFNTYAAAQQAAGVDEFDDFVALDPAGWDRLGRHLEKAVLSVAERQIATAGLAATQLWFDLAREHWVPASSRAFSNFMIDTTDMTDMLTHEEWLSIPEAERTFAAPLPAAKVFGTVLVNELQIELGLEEAYVTRLRELATALAASPGDAALAAQLEGARFVWAAYTGTMRSLTEAKGAAIIERLRRAGANQNIGWGAPADSKGNLALKIVADRD